jgi:hypothetical protein
MRTDTTREIIANELNSANTMTYLLDELQDTDPNHYGIGDLNVAVDKEDILVEEDKKTFNFKDASLFFTARMMGSSEESGFDKTVSVTTSGAGTFHYVGDNDLKISSIRIDDRLDLYSN